MKNQQISNAARLIVLMGTVISMLAGCKPNAATTPSLNENWTNPTDVQSGFAQKAKEKGDGLIDFIKSMDAKKVTTSNRNVSVYSLQNSKNCLTICVVFNQDNPLANMRDFVGVANEIGRQIFTQPKKIEDKMMGIFLGLTPDGEAVCGFSMYPQIQVFSLAGFDFMSGKAYKYRDAYDALIKEKSRKNDISEWDYFFYRSSMEPELGNLGDVCDRAMIGVANTTMMELYKFRNGFENTLLSNKAMSEQIFSAVTNREVSHQIMKMGLSINTIWFDGAGKRIMAEMARQLPSGKIEKERKWYNGYKAPE